MRAPATVLHSGEGCGWRAAGGAANGAIAGDDGTGSAAGAIQGRRQQKKGEQGCRATGAAAAAGYISPGVLSLNGFPEVNRRLPHRMSG
jgi:hypothetical protein